MLLRVFASEWMKIRGSMIWLPVLVAAALATASGLIGSRTDMGGDTLTWHSLYLMSILYYAMLFLPLLAGVFSAMLCRFEHLGGGWKQLLALPVKRSHLYLCKLAFVAALLALTQLLVGAGVLLVGASLGISDPVPWRMLGESLLSGWAASLPLAALQLWASVSWKSFGAPFALNVIFTLPAILIANSDTYGPFYPWAQPLLAMLPRDNGMFQIPTDTIFTVVLCSALVTIGGGLIHFARRDVQA